jgi:ABC-type multidrug transport system permease subunit
MKRKEFQETFHKLLIALAVFDNVFIISAIFTLIIRYVLYAKYIQLQAFFRTFSLLDYKHLGFLSPIFMAMIITASFAMVTSMYLTLAIRCGLERKKKHSYKFFFSIERYFGICYPIQSRVRGRRRVFVYLLPVIVGR